MHVDAEAEAERPHPAEIRGQSGRHYMIERVLQDKGSLLGRVFLARYAVSERPSVGFQLNYYRGDDEKFILKEIPPNNYEFRLEIYQRLGSCPYVRGLEDTCADQSIFIFKYLRENLLGLVQKNLPITATKKILRDALQGLAAMLDKDIVHNGSNSFHVWKARQLLTS